MTLGAVSVPVDPHHPEARRLAMLREASVALVSGDPSDSGLQWAASEFTTVDLVCTDLNKVPSHPADYQNAVTPEADAFVEFTSGSTGKPKGIVQTHQGIVTIGKALAHGLRVTASARVAQIAPYIFDVAMMEFAMSFIAAWVYYGANGFERDINFAFSNASYHTDLIDKSPDFRLISSNPPSCLQVCFYSTPGGILSDSSAENSKCTKEIVKRMVNRGFMFDFAPGREGHLFRVVINCQTLPSNLRWRDYLRDFVRLDKSLEQSEHTRAFNFDYQYYNECRYANRKTCHFPKLPTTYFPGDLIKLSLFVVFANVSSHPFQSVVIFHHMNIVSAAN